ncbi:MAG: hypothetical protein Kow00124_04960 [Anaerolineae bacterium]
MKTPAGKECRFYYEDFHRGRSRQECRLIQRDLASPPWKPGDCATCPVPDILWANASEDLMLRASVKKGVLGIGRRVVVQAHCRRHDIPIADPFVGCEACASERPGMDVFFSGESDT